MAARRYVESTAPKNKAPLISCNVGRLTEKTWAEILNYLEAPQLLNLARANCWFSDMASDESLWQRLCISMGFKKRQQPPVPVEAYSGRCHKSVRYYKDVYMREMKIRSNLWNWKAKKTEVKVSARDDWFVERLYTTSKYAIAVSYEGIAKVFTLPHLTVHAEIIIGKCNDKTMDLDEFLLLTIPDSEKDIGIWSMDTFKRTGELTGHTKRVTSIKLLNNEAVSASDDLTIKKWNLDTKQADLTVTFITDKIRSVDFNKSVIAAGLEEGTVTLLDSASGEILWSVEVTDGPAFDIRILGMFVAANGTDFVFSLIDKQVGVLDRELTAYVDYINLPCDFFPSERPEDSLKMLEVNNKFDMLEKICENDASSVTINNGIMCTCTKDGIITIYQFHNNSSFTYFESQKRRLPIPNLFSADGSKILYVMPGAGSPDTLCLLDFDH